MLKLETTWWQTINWLVGAGYCLWRYSSFNGTDHDFFRSPISVVDLFVYGSMVVNMIPKRITGRCEGCSNRAF